MEKKEKKINQSTQLTDTQDHKHEINLDLNDWFVDVDNKNLLEKKTSEIPKTEKTKSFIDFSNTRLNSSKIKRIVLSVIVVILLVAIGVVTFFLIKESQILDRSHDYKEDEETYVEYNEIYEEQSVVSPNLQKQESTTSKISGIISSIISKEDKTQQGVTIMNENQNNSDSKPDDSHTTINNNVNDNRVKIPDVAGLTESQATKLLSDFNVEIVMIYADNVPKGYALSPTRPEAGTLVTKNSDVYLYISAGSGEAAWSEWSEKKPTGTDISYIYEQDDNSKDGKGILVDTKSMFRYRNVYLDKTTDEIVVTKEWSDWQNGSSANEGIEKISTAKTEKYQFAMEFQNQTFYRWRYDYTELGNS